MVCTRAMKVIYSLPVGLKLLEENGTPIPQGMECRFPLPQTQEQLKKLDEAAWFKPLEALYENNKVVGCFSPEPCAINWLIACKQSPSMYTNLAGAFQKILHYAFLTEEGYTVLEVQHNNTRDLLLMDLQQQAWVSIQQSRQAVATQCYNQLREQTAHVPNDVLQDMARQGVYIQWEDRYEPAIINITTDGILWDPMDAEVGTHGAEIWDAWCNEMYIQYDPQQHKAQFAVKKGAQLFNSLKELHDAF